MKVIIVGNGIAGNEVAFKLREHNANHEIAIISGEKFPEYDPCSLTYYIGGDVPREIVFRRKLEDYINANIQLILGSNIVSINSEGCYIVTEKGEKHFYDKLVLAYGGCLFVPPIKCINKADVFGCKKLEDADKLFKHKGHSAVVIGSGAIGIEIAEALKKKDYDVTIIELLNWILPTMFDKPAAKILNNALERYGIRVLVNEKVLQIDGEKKVIGIITDKHKISCDTVVLATGVKVDKKLPHTANIKVNSGIVVNEYMETNIKDIYACGDCVESREFGSDELCTNQLKHNAIDQARIVAKNILGDKVSYSGTYFFARAHFFDTYAVAFGKTQQTLKDKNNINIIERNIDKSYLRVVLKQDKIIGAQAIGEFADHIGLLMGSSWQGDDINQLKCDWKNVCRISSPYPWTYRRMGALIGLNLLE